MSPRPDTGTRRECPWTMPKLTIRDMMVANVKTLHEDDPVTLASWDMAASEFRHIPVVDYARRVVGIVSDRDVLRAMAQHPGMTMVVKQVMSRDVRVISAGAAAMEAAVHMLQSKHSAMPVVDGDVLVGIVTTTDFVELARRALAGLDVNAPHARA